ncbi:MAG: tetratricopeptide repeat protein [Vicinamibacterales bacterium]
MRTRCTSFVFGIALLVPVAASAQPSGLRDRATIPYNLGVENMRAEAWPEAEKAFRTAIDIDPQFEMAYYMLGRTYMAGKSFTQAAAAYERCRAIYRQQDGRQFSNAHERQRNRDTRLREIDEVIRSYLSGPQTAAILDAIRQLQNQRRDIQEAMNRGASTMTLSVSVPSYVLSSLGSAYFRMGKLADAEREYKAAIAADPKAGEAYSNLAVVYMETGRLVDAEKSVRSAEKIGFRVHPQLKEDIKNRKKVPGF